MRPLFYKNAIALAIEDALRKKGIIVPQDTPTPMIVTSEWLGPRDRV